MGVSTGNETENCRGIIAGIQADNKGIMTLLLRPILCCRIFVETMPDIHCLWTWESLPWKSS